MGFVRLKPTCQDGVEHQGAEQPHQAGRQEGQAAVRVVCPSSLVLLLIVSPLFKHHLFVSSVLTLLCMLIVILPTVIFHSTMAGAFAPLSCLLRLHPLAHLVCCSMCDVHSFPQTWENPAEKHPATGFGGLFSPLVFRLTRALSL